MAAQDNSRTGSGPETSADTATWGKWVFGVVLVATLVFFWWLLIYDHGVVSAH